MIVGVCGLALGAAIVAGVLVWYARREARLEAEDRGET